MNRRDFLLFRREKKDRILELSCERLYMRYVDVRAGAARRAEQAAATSDLEWWSGEPPTVIREPTPEELFAELERELTSVDVLQIVGSDWLVNEDFSRELASVLASFSAGGGRVEFVQERSSRPSQETSPSDDL